MKAIIFLSTILIFSNGFAQEVIEKAGSEVEVVTKTGKLYGTLLGKTLPRKTVVLLIAGSGPTDRNGNSAAGLQTNCLKMVAEGLNENGIASLRYDKRGIGKSSAAVIAESDLRFDTYIEDADAWIEWLVQQGFEKIIIAGHSEGSLIGMAAIDKKVQGFISLAGAGRPIDVVVEEQVASNPPLVQQQVASIFDSLKSGHEVKNVPTYLMSLFRPSVQPYIMSWLKYNPSEIISELKVPVLIVQGNTDIQVSEKDATLLHEALPSSKLVIIDGMNHIFKTAPLDRNLNMGTYNQPDLPLHEKLIPTMVEFINRLP